VRSSGGRTKRVLDLFAGSIAFAVSIPIIVAATLATRLSGDSGPVFYRAVRVGEGGATFAMMKLRTMVSAPGGPGVTRAQDPRVTSMGRILRRLKIDELPQLWNVVRGQMSLVGPRIIHPSELSRYGRYGEKRLQVQPGLTGLWQISGRQHISYEERVALDMQYIDTRSLWLDLVILVKTFKVFIIHTGA